MAGEARFAYNYALGGPTLAVEASPLGPHTPKTTTDNHALVSESTTAFPYFLAQTSRRLEVSRLTLENDNGITALESRRGRIGFWSALIFAKIASGAFPNAFVGALENGLTYILKSNTAIQHHP